MGQGTFILEARGGYDAIELGFYIIIIYLFPEKYHPVAMNNNASSNIVSVLKQKMMDSREEALKYKEKIQELENKFQVRRAISRAKTNWNAFECDPMFFRSR